jgi:hypothetical protein
VELTAYRRRLRGAGSGDIGSTIVARAASGHLQQQRATPIEPGGPTSRGGVERVRCGGIARGI